MDMQDNDTDIPASIKRPLLLATLALCLALFGLGTWAAVAPLATTIRANGTIASAAPSYDVQHPFGGHIARVNVEAQSLVSAGQVMFELDVSVQSQNLALVEGHIAGLLSENGIIWEALGLSQRGAERVQAKAALQARYDGMQLQLETEVDATEATAAAARMRAQSIEAGISILEQRVAAMKHRSGQMTALVKKGVLAKAQTGGQTDLLLTVQSQINTQMSDLIQLQDQARQADRNVRNLRTKHRVQLLNQLKANAERLPQLERQAVNLRSEIESAVVRSPGDGVVVLLGFDTEQMYAPRGTTLLTLSQPLKDPSVDFTIPPQAIDQVHAGMEGALTIPALPQRNLPKVRIRLNAIAPDAKRDRDGNVLGYPAKAQIYPEDMEKIVAAMNGNLHLSTDMPVSVALEGRTVTFAQYLFGPFMTIFKGSLQD
jgi:HlyD family type I secretion membrane fusion protein